ncbi:MAG: energy transducer TonB [Bryobacteraceae bacterium]
MQSIDWKNSPGGNTEPPGRRIRTLAASLALHGMAAVLLMAVHFDAKRDGSAFPPHAVMLSPPLYLRLPEPAKPKPVVRARAKSPSRKKPRLQARLVPSKRGPVRAAVTAKKFVAPERAKQNAQPEMTALALNVVPEPSAPPAPASLPKLAVAPAPPLKTDNFGATQQRAVLVNAPATLRPAGFAASETGTVSTAQRAQIAASGFGAVEAGSESRTARRVSGSKGFDALPLETSPRRVPAKIASAEFGDSAAAAPREVRVKKTEAADTSAVEILSKPRPAYTAEARGLGVEGEVLVEVLFAASGEARVLRLIRGLGHGLDETAADAARAIRFRPAMRGGQAVESTAVVHIRFQLAY